MRAKTYRTKDDWKKLGRVPKRDISPSAYTTMVESLYEENETRRLKPSHQTRTNEIEEV